MISTDDPRDESPGCLYCDHQIGLNVDTIALTVGAKARSKKSGQWFFMPERFDDNADVKWFHLHCLMQTFDFSQAPDDPDDDGRCMFCGAPLEEEIMYYEFALGRFQVEGRDTVWMPTHYKSGGRNKTVRSYACHDCAFEGLGEGNSEMARYILGMDPKEEETVSIRTRIPIRVGTRTIPRRAAK